MQLSAISTALSGIACNDIKDRLVMKSKITLSINVNRWSGIKLVQFPSQVTTYVYPSAARISLQDLQTSTAIIAYIVHEMLVLGPSAMMLIRSVCSLRLQIIHQ